MIPYLVFLLIGWFGLPNSAYGTNCLLSVCIYLCVYLYGIMQDGVFNSHASCSKYICTYIHHICMSGLWYIKHVCLIWWTCLFVAHTLNSAYKEKKYAEILLQYRQLFVKGNIIIGEWGIFGVEIFLCYSWFFVKGDFVIGGVECVANNMWRGSYSWLYCGIYMQKCMPVWHIGCTSSVCNMAVIFVWW